MIRLAFATETAARVEFRPVLEALGPGQDPALGTAELTPLDQQLPDAEITVADDDGLVYRLGPVALSGAAIEGADATRASSGDWRVQLVFRAGPEGIDRFNELAGRCFEGGPTCPGLGMDGRGQLAVVLDGTVVSAPTINVASFARDQIVISGSGDRAEAEALAVALRYGSTPFTLQPLD